MAESSVEPLDFYHLLDELESDNSGSCANVIRKLREHEVAAYQAGVGGPTGGLIANFIALLDERVADKELEIEKACSHNYQSFVDSVKELLCVQEEAEKLQSTLSEIRSSILDEVQKLNESFTALSASQSTLEQIDQCIAALQNSLPVLDQYERIEKSIADGRYYHALKTLEHLEHYQLKSIQSYTFSACLLKRIPELRAEIKSASLAQLTDFLEEIRKHSVRLGAITMRRIAEKIGMKDDFLASSETKQQHSHDNGSTSDVNDSDESHCNQKKPGKSKVLEAELKELAAASIPMAPDDPNNTSPWGHAKTNIEDVVNFGPVYRCLHIYAVAGERAEFEHYYFTQRKKQCQLILSLSPSQQASLRNYSEFFSTLVGFFLLDDYLRHTMPGAGSSYQTYLNDLWGHVVPKLVQFATKNAESCKTNSELLCLKHYSVLFEYTMAHLGFHTAGLSEMLEAVRKRYNALLISQWREKLTAIVADDNYTAITLNSSKDLIPPLSTYLSSCSPEFSALAYPRVLAFSPMVPKIYMAIRDYIDACFVFVENVDLSLTARSLYQYNVDVCRLSEVRLPDSGSREIKIPGVESHFTLYHSGPRDSSGRHGVAIALSQQAELALLAWEPVNDRMAYVRLKGHFTNISIVAVSAPTSAAEQRDKEAFYSQLQALVERLPRRDLLIVAGDWNGRTGPGDPTTSHLLGRFGLGSRCENGERLLNFADRNRLLVTNTCFQHRKKHLLTWYSNDGRTASQIDYILVSSRFRSWVHDSRSMHGAETGNAHGSDHVLVRTRLKVHLSSAPKMPRQRRLNVAKFRQASTAEALSREIRTCFTARVDAEVSNQWSSLKTSVYGAAEKILGYTQRRRSDLISGRTLQMSAQTARARSRNDDYFRQLRKMTAKSARDDRKQYWAEIATSMEQASNVGDTRKLYRLIRQVSGKLSTLSDSVRDVNGGFIADNSAKVERWREHFEHHLNFDTQPTSPLFSSSAEFLPSPSYAVSCDPPSEEEVADAIRKLRKNKAPGEDGIPAEIFKSCVDTLAPWLHEVIERAWRDEVVPDDWGLGILVSILKKGDKTRCENYRGISLIDVAAKIFAIVLLRRFQAVCDSRTRPNQAGFRAGRGCADQIFTLRHILEFRHSYQQPTAVCFIDFAATFDSVHRESLWRIMALDGVPEKIIAMIKAYYRSTTARVLVRNSFSQPFGIRSGVRQGCILSPILFNYAIDWILGRALRDSDGVEFAPGHRLTDLDYADDIALLASSFGDLQSMVSRVNEVAKSVGLSINAGKTKVFSSCIRDQEKAPLEIDGCQLEEVDSFKYLGARLLPNGQSKDDIVSRINAVRWVFSCLQKCL
nr:unnamed protein product [Spirometra erinaceieuropaei]